MMHGRKNIKLRETTFDSPSKQQGL